MRSVGRRSLRRAVWPWAAFAAWLAVPPLVWPHGWMLAYFAQTAALIVLALSYNLLLGTTGLLSFGHAAFAGLGAFAAAHVFNRFGLPLPLLPLAGGLAGAGLGALFGFVATRRSGTAFAMITLGLGELIAAAAWSVPGWFGGAGGVSIDRTSGPAWGTWDFGSAGEAYTVIAVWCIVAALAMRALTRTPFARLANAVRDNPARVAALGTDPRRVRHAMFVAAAFFAGIAGTLTLINVEVAATESVGMLRSGMVLFATVIGGASTFFGPVAGAVVLTFFSVLVASVSRAWLLYLGLVFVAVVSVAPAGIGGWVGSRLDACRRHGFWRQCRRDLPALCAVVAWVLAIVLAAELGYAWQFAQDEGRIATIGRWRFDAGAPAGWCIAGAAVVAALAFSRFARRRLARAPATAWADAEHESADGQADEPANPSAEERR